MKSEILFLFEYKSVVVVVTWFDVAGLSEDFVMLTLFCLIFHIQSDAKNCPTPNFAIF